jgi:hypothetical protein
LEYCELEYFQIKDKRRLVLYQTLLRTTVKLKSNLIKYNSFELTRLLISERRLLDAGFEYDLDYSKGVTNELKRIISEGKHYSKLIEL